VAKSLQIPKPFGWMLWNAGAEGTLRFPDLGRFALRVLSLPFSNAAVERAFSVMNAVKTKVRNHMSIDLLAAILRVRLRFGVTKRCCNKFQPTQRMFELFTADMYACSARLGAAQDPGFDLDAGFEEALTLFPAEDDAIFAELLDEEL
jgi:hypothetical protein